MNHNPVMYTNIRRKTTADNELQSVTITLPKSVLIELANSGIESQRGGGNLSSFIEISALIVLGIFENQEMATEQLQRLIRADFDTNHNLALLADNLESLVQRIINKIE